MARAENCPSGPIHLIVGFPPGDAADLGFIFIAPPAISRRFFDKENLDG